MASNWSLVIPAMSALGGVIVTWIGQQVTARRANFRDDRKVLNERKRDAYSGLSKTLFRVRNDASELLNNSREIDDRLERLKALSQEISALQALEADRPDERVSERVKALTQEVELLAPQAERSAEAQKRLKQRFRDHEDAVIDDFVQLELVVDAAVRERFLRLTALNTMLTSEADLRQLHDDLLSAAREDLKEV